MYNYFNVTMENIPFMKIGKTLHKVNKIIILITIKLDRVEEREREKMANLKCFFTNESNLELI